MSGFNLNTGAVAVTIPHAGVSASISPEIDIGDNVYLAFQIPSTWPATTKLSFQGSIWGANSPASSPNFAANGGSDRQPLYVPIFNDAGTELSLTAVASQLIVITSAAFMNALRAVRFIKLVAGTNESLATLSADQLIGVILKRNQ